MVYAKDSHMVRAVGKRKNCLNYFLFNYESAPALVIVFSLCNYDSGNSTLNNTGSAISMTFITVTFLAQIHFFCLERIFSHDLKGR